MRNSQENIKDENNQPIKFIAFENNKLIINPEGKEIISKIESELGILSLVGKSRTGKSFLLNRVILNQSPNFGFQVGKTFKPCTKGIWLWPHPIMVQDSTSKPFPTFIIDTEGLCGYDEEINHDTKIFLVAILISSLFVFNSFGPIDENSLNSLDVVLNLSKILHTEEKKEEKNPNGGQKNEEPNSDNDFPTLLWLLRDFVLKLEDKDGNEISSKEYLENALAYVNDESKNKIRKSIKDFFPNRDCFTFVRPCENEHDLQNLNTISIDKLRPEFVQEIKQFKEKINMLIKPKTIHRKNALQKVNGKMLMEFVSQIVNAVNNESIPVIESTWRYVIEGECIKVFNKEVKDYENVLRDYAKNHSGDPDFKKNFAEFSHKIINDKTKKINENELFDKDVKDEYINKMNKKLEEIFTQVDKENNIELKRKFEKLIENGMNEIEMIVNNSANIPTNSSTINEFFSKVQNLIMEISKVPEAISSSKNSFSYDNPYYRLVLQIKKYMSSRLQKQKFQFEAELKKISSNTSTLSLNLNSELDYDKLTDELVLLRKKEKIYEDLLSRIRHEKQIEKEAYERRIQSLTESFKEKLALLSSQKNKIETNLRVKEEQILVMKLNLEKIQNLHNQKVTYLQNEIDSQKAEYEKRITKYKINEKINNEEISVIKAQNESLKKERDNSMHTPREVSS